VVSQTPKGFKVEADGKVCLQTDKVRIPRGYYFGLTAATTETPDSFELFNLLVSSPQVGKVERNVPRDEPRGQQKQQQHQQHQQQQKQQQQHGGKVEKLPNEQNFHEWRVEYGEEDHEAAYYKSQEEQFSDVHDRLQALVCLLRHRIDTRETDSGAGTSFGHCPDAFGHNI
jgi:mannose-binding lectin 1